MTSTRHEHPISSNSDAEDEHFRISDSIISWMENCNSLRDDNPETSLTTILPPPTQPLLNDHQSSAPGVAWNLVRIFRMKKLKHLVDIRMQLYYLKIYISTCPQCEQLNLEYSALTNQHMLQGDVHAYTLNSLVDINNGKLHGYLNDLVNRSITHVANCDRCRAKGHYCQLCGPSGMMSSMMLSNNSGSNNNVIHQISGGSNVPASSINNLASSSQTTISQVSSKTSSQPIVSTTHSMPLSHLQASASGSSMTSLRSVNDLNDHELIFPFEIGRVAQCHACGCCFHSQCFIDAGQNCPKCERIQRRKAEEINQQQQQQLQHDNYQMPSMDTQKNSNMVAMSSDSSTIPASQEAIPNRNG